jgi:hypothetical protein
LLFLFVVRGFSCRNLRFADSGDEAVEEEPKAQEPMPSVSSASKGNPAKEPVKEAPVLELPKKSLGRKPNAARRTLRNQIFPLRNIKLRPL